MKAKIKYQDATNRIEMKCGGYWSLMRAMECLLELARKDQLGESKRKEEDEERLREEELERAMGWDEKV